MDSDRGPVKWGGTVPLSVEMLYRQRPPLPPLTRRQKLRWALQERVHRLRMQLASWVAGFDVEDDRG